MFRVAFGKASRLNRLTAGLVVPSNFRVRLRWVVVLEVTSGLVVRCDFLKVFCFLVMYVELVLFLIACRVICRLALHFLKTLFRCHPVNLFRLAIARRLVRSKRYLTHFNGRRRSTSKAVRTINRPGRGVTQLVVFLFRMLFRRLQREDVANLISLGSFEEDLVSCGGVVVLMGGCRVAYSCHHRPKWPILVRAGACRGPEG